MVEFLKKGTPTIVHFWTIIVRLSLELKFFSNWKIDWWALIKLLIRRKWTSVFHFHLLCIQHFKFIAVFQPLLFLQLRYVVAFAHHSVHKSDILRADLSIPVLEYISPAVAMLRAVFFSNFIFCACKTFQRKWTLYSCLTVCLHYEFHSLP